MRKCAGAVALLGVPTVEYRCPTHGKVDPEDPGVAVPTCPMILRRTVDGDVVAEPCGLPLTAYLE